MLSKLKERGRELIKCHGAEVGVVAKIVANVLIPGAPMVVNAVETVCDYAADKNQELTDEYMMEIIGGLDSDVSQLESLL